MKAVKAHLQEKNPERVEAFEKNAQTFAKKIIGNFKDYEFYVGESMNPDGMVALLNYREDGTTPYVSTSSKRPPPVFHRTTPPHHLSTHPPVVHSALRLRLLLPLFPSTNGFGLTKSSLSGKMD